MKDKFGQDLAEGDYIVYSKTQGRSGVLGCGVIIGFDTFEGAWRQKPLERVIVESVQGFEFGKSSWRDPYRAIVRLTYPERILKLEPPPEALVELYSRAFSSQEAMQEHRRQERENATL